MGLALVHFQEYWLLRGWFLVLGLKEGLVECATVCVKSVVILISQHGRQQLIQIYGLVKLYFPPSSIQTSQDLLLFQFIFVLHATCINYCYLAPQIYNNSNNIGIHKQLGRHVQHVSGLLKLKLVHNGTNHFMTF